MSLDQVLHLAEVIGLLLMGAIGLLLMRVLDRMEKKLDKHDEKLEVYGNRIVSLETRRSSLR